MANFVCDICGGAIKMQANKTGVCQNCGMEYDIEAIRAMAGQKTNNKPAISTSVQTTTSVHVNEDKIDRDVLLIYLSEIRVLETAINESNNKKVLLENKCRKVAESVKKSYEHKELINSRMRYFKTACAKPGLDSFKKIEESVKYNMPIGISLILIGLLLTLFNPFLSVLVIIGVCFIVSYFSTNKAAADRRKKEFEETTRKIIEESKEADERYEKEMAGWREFNNNKTSVEQDINTEIEEFSAILEKAYNANIIPMQFRTIEGVYYLYDYLSTSNQSLSEALMQANLEAIKQKLDDMIKLQSVQIIQQAQTNAKLDDIQDTNNRILATAQQNARNSSLAAKYAAITAVNTEVIKQLSQKQLAYQRADFWLK